MSKIAFAGPWVGEFGWEIMTWQSYLRKKSHNYDRMIISTFPGMEALYTGFHCAVEFMPHRQTERALDWRDVSNVEHGFNPANFTCPVERIEPIKQYRTDGEYVRYGTPRDTGIEVLFHARGIQKSTFKNYPIEQWNDIAAAFPKAASIGTMDDMFLEGTEDKRGIPLQELMDLMASAQVVVGQSSGVMHLASLCGTRQVVWAEDNKTYFNEKLEQRYRETWNPFNTPVSWVNTANWDPNTDDVILAVLSGGAGKRPSNNILDKLKKAVESGRYIVTLAYIGEKEGKEMTESFCETVNFPNAALESAMQQMKDNMDEILQKSLPGKEVNSIWR